MNVDGLLSRTVFSNTPDGFSYQHCILPNLYIICNLHLIFYSVNAKLFMYSTCICCWHILFPFFSVCLGGPKDLVMYVPLFLDNHITGRRLVRQTLLNLFHFYLEYSKAVTMQILY